MTAKEMFENIEYEQTLDDKKLSVYKFSDGEFYSEITFNDYSDICCIYQATKLDKSRVDLNINELRAIFAKCKEWGWLDE